MSYEDTYNTLRYANRAKEIKVDVSDIEVNMYILFRVFRSINELKSVCFYAEFVSFCVCTLVSTIVFLVVIVVLVEIMEFIDLALVAALLLGII